MKIKVSFNVGDLERRAINARVGKPGLASRAEVEGYLWGCASAELQVTVSEHHPCILDNCIGACDPCVDAGGMVVNDHVKLRSR